MAMMLRAGTPSVPSSAIGKVMSPPAVASSVAGDERTGEGTEDWAAIPEFSLGGCVAGLNQGALIAASQNIAPRVRFGISATRMRPATNARIAERVSKELSGVWSTGPRLAHVTSGAGLSVAVLTFPCNRPRLSRDLAVGARCRRRLGREPSAGIRTPCLLVSVTLITGRNCLSKKAARQ